MCGSSKIPPCCQGLKNLYFESTKNCVPIKAFDLLEKRHLSKCFFHILGNFVEK